MMPASDEPAVPRWAALSVRTQLEWAAQTGREVDFAGQTIPAETFRSVCLGNAVAAGALRLRNAVFAGPVDLSGADLPFVLELRACRFPAPLRLQSTRVRALDLSGCYLVGGLCARGLQVSSDAVFGPTGSRPFSSDGEISLDHARIEGDLRFTSAILKPEPPPEPAGEAGEAACSLSAECARIGGSLILGRGFLAAASVNLSAAQIGGALNCIGGSFLDRGEHCLFADGITVKQSVTLCSDFGGRGWGEFQVRGCVSLAGADIGGQLACSGGHFSSGVECLFAQDAHIHGSVFLDGEFLGAAPTGVAVRDAAQAGSVSFNAATIDGNLLCGRGSFLGRPAPEEGRFVYRNGGFLWLAGGSTSPRHEPTLAGLDLRRVTVRGDAVFGRKCRLTGCLCGAGAQFEGDLRLQEPTLGCLDLAGAEVRGTLEIGANVKLTLGLGENRAYPLDLRNAHAGTLCDCFGPVAGKADERGKLYRLAGFTCDGFDRDMGRKGGVLAAWIQAADQRSWQSRGPGQHHVHVYSNFAQVLRAEGQEVEAAELAIRQRRDGRDWAPDRGEIGRLRDWTLGLVWLAAVGGLWLRAPALQAPWRQWLPVLAAALAIVLILRRPQRLLRAAWNLVLDVTVGYGYRPSLALVWLVAIWALGTAIYSAGWRAGVIVPGAEALVEAHARRTEQVRAQLLAGEPGWPNRPLSPQQQEARLQQALARDLPDRLSSPPYRLWPTLPPDPRSPQLWSLLPPEYPPFRAWAYVLDRLLPIVQFGYARHWMPDQHTAGGRALFLADWLLTGLGWMLSLLFAGAVSGILRKP